MKKWRIAAIVAIGIGIFFAILGLPFILGVIGHWVINLFMLGWGVIK